MTILLVNRNQASNQYFGLKKVLRNIINYEKLVFTNFKITKRRSYQQNKTTAVTMP